MARTSYFGNCILCGKRMGKAGMTRHLKTCAPEHDRPRGKPGRLFHLRVEGAQAPMYWLHVEMKAKGQLFDLDAFLRDIWVECCGHLSAFEIGRGSYSSSGEADPYDEMIGDASMDVSMDRALLNAPPRFGYDYDFGTTTSLVLRVLGERQGTIGPAPLRLLARNEPPDWPCRVCRKPATRICTSCMWGDQNPFLCDTHAPKHRCDCESFLPVANSPRMGICGYTGGR